MTMDANKVFLLLLNMYHIKDLPLMGVFSFNLSLIIGHIATAMLPLIMNNLNENTPTLA